jgi:hypothetical protein
MVIGHQKGYESRMKIQKSWHGIVRFVPRQNAKVAGPFKIGETNSSEDLNIFRYYRLTLTVQRGHDFHSIFTGHGSREKSFILHLHLSSIQLIDGREPMFSHRANQIPILVNFDEML